MISWISEISSLEKISANGNTIDEIPPWLTKLTNLKYLRFGHSVGGGNPIRTVPAWINQITQLTELSLEGVLKGLRFSKNELIGQKNCPSLIFKAGILCTKMPKN